MKLKRHKLLKDYNSYLKDKFKELKKYNKTKNNTLK